MRKLLALELVSKDEAKGYLSAINGKKLTQPMRKGVCDDYVIHPT